MSHEVESMMYLGDVPWHGLGTPVDTALSGIEALRMAGLDWDVVSEPIYLEDGTPIDGYRANVRATDRAQLGVVSDRYQIVQNRDALAWVDSLLGEPAQLETAGSLAGGRYIWLMARLREEYRVLGDPTTLFLTFTNGHDGSHALRVMASPVRVVCANTLNFATRAAVRSYTMIHTSNIEANLAQARDVLGFANQYMARFHAVAEHLADIRFTAAEWNDLCQMILPHRDRSVPEPKRLIQDRELLNMSMYRPDQAAWLHTGWGAVNAAAWVTSHTVSPKSRPDRAMERFIDGEPLVTRTVDVLLNPQKYADTNEDSDAVLV
ncbi:MAG: hypothetical protein C7B46_19995 [Sulfobacillus benefaciens]|uniref:DUF932 domain-containing protein n=1 Tax=Sulfobacillus benefaciens TaxID=453960 RepID=A0A2T2WVZ3_9FIRM|nr:MAG: hypothetical protein C7B46_19995 [Sulfobacillus benefaciens]